MEGVNMTPTDCLWHGSPHPQVSRPVHGYAVSPTARTDGAGPAACLHWSDVSGFPRDVAFFASY